MSAYDPAKEKTKLRKRSRILCSWVTSRQRSWISILVLVQTLSAICQMSYQPTTICSSSLHLNGQLSAHRGASPTCSSLLSSPSCRFISLGGGYKHISVSQSVMFNAARYKVSEYPHYRKNFRGGSTRYYLSDISAAATFPGDFSICKAVNHGYKDFIAKSFHWVLFLLKSSPDEI